MIKWVQVLEETDQLIVSESQSSLRSKHERTTGPPYMAHPLPSLTVKLQPSILLYTNGGQFRSVTT